MEILAPAGGKQGFYAAVNAGADAVYLGLKDFSARASAENFTFEELSEILAYAKPFGVKVYLTVNTVLKDGELALAEENIVHAWNLGVDAFIVQDFYFGAKMKTLYPEIVFHLSTQAGVSNVFFAKYAKAMGYSRVVLSRETPIKEIKAIASIIETEVFIQGALCTCFSGHCYFSSFVGGNSGNRGRCKQPCRKKYSFHKDGWNTTPSYAISLADLSVGEYVNELKEAGVSSLKIEGRMRRPEYSAAATEYYRALIDGEPISLARLSRVYNRGDYTRGYLAGQDKKLISDKIQNHKGVKIGTVQEIRGNTCLVRSSYVPSVGDGFKMINEIGETGGGIYKNARQTPFGFYVSYGGSVSVGDAVHITTDVALNQELLSKKRLLPVSLNACLTEGKAELRLTCNEVEITVESDDVLLAKTAPMTKKQVAEQILKTGEYPVEIIEKKISVAPGLFITKGNLNALRRSAYEKLFALLSENKNAQMNCLNAFSSPSKKGEERTGREEFAVITDNVDFPVNAFTSLIYAPTDYHDTEEITALFEKTKNYAVNVYLYLPPFFTEDDAKVVYPYIKRFYGVFAQSLYGVEFANRLKMPLFLGEECNFTNQIDLEGATNSFAERITLSKELSLSEIESLSQFKAFVPSLGAIKLMQLCYCPMGKTCKTCRVPGTFVMRDEAKREFPVRRYRLNGCKFEVFNNASLLPPKFFDKNLLNFLSLTSAERTGIATAIPNLNACKKVLKTITGGHFVKGVE